MVLLRHEACLYVGISSHEVLHCLFAFAVEYSAEEGTIRNVGGKYRDTRERKWEYVGKRIDRLRVLRKEGYIVLAVAYHGGMDRA